LAAPIREGKKERMTKMDKSVFLWTGLAVFIFGMAFHGAVEAQQKEVTPSIAGSEMELDVTVRKEDTLTGEQKLAWVDEQTAKARQSKIAVQNMLDRARREKDTIKITCLDDKLTQMNVNIRGIEERTVGLETAVRADDAQGANQQFTILKVYIVRVQGLVAEAENCIGDVDVVLGESETIVTIDDDIIAEDPSESGTIQVEDPAVSQPSHRSGYY
jgi:hypothetical protein